MKSSSPTRKHLAIFLIALAGSTAGFAQDKPEKKITFQDDVYPILEDACLNCHNPDEAKGGLDLSTYGATMEGGSGGPIALSGDPSGSRILLSVLHREEPFMPPKKPMLEKPNLETLSKWIEGGLLDNPNSKPRKKSVPDFAMTLSETPAGKPEGPPPMPGSLLLDPVVVAPRSTAVQDIATSPWAPLAALTGQNQVLLYHTDTRRLLGVLPFPEGFPESLSFSRNGSLLLAGGGVGGKTGKAVAWDITTGKRVIEVGSEFDTVLAADISPNQANVALGGPKRNIKIFDTRSGELVHNLKKHPDWLLELAYSPSGKYLASGGRSGGLYLWDAPKGLEFFTLKGHTKAITGIAWRDDSRMLATSSEDSQVILWNPADGRQIRKWSNTTPALAIHFDHAGNIVTAGRDKKGRIFDQNGKLLRTLEGFEEIVLGTAFSHDDKRIVAADWTGTVSVYNSADGARTGSLESNPPAIATRLASLEERRAGMTAKVAAAKKAYDALVQKKAAIAKQQADLQKSVADLTGQRKAQEAAVAEHKKALPGLQKQLEQLAASATAKEKSLAAAIANMNQAREQLAEVQSQLQEWRKRLDAETKTAASKPALFDPAQVILLADNSPNPKIPAPKAEAATQPAAKPTPPPAKTPAPKTEPKPKPAPTPAVSKTPAANPAKKDAGKPAPTTTPAPAPATKTPAAKPAPTKAPAVTPAPKPAATPTPTPVAKPAPAKPAPAKPAPKPAPSEAVQKVSTLTAQLKTAEGDMKAAQSAESQARQALDAEVAKRDAMAKQVADRKTRQAAAEKALKDLAASIAKMDGEQKGLTASLAEVAKAEPASKKAYDDANAAAAALPKEIAFWKAAFFHVDVINETRILDEMTLNLPEAPSIEERASLERQKLKVTALENHHATMLTQ